MGDVLSQPGAGREFDLSDPVRSFLDTTIAVVRQPARFFAQVPTNAGFLNPLIYSLVCTVIAVALAFLAFEVFGIPSIGSFSVLTDSVTGAETEMTSTTVLYVLLSLLTIPIIAGIWHVAVRIVLKRENAGFQATLRAMAYSSALLLLDWLPFIGWVFGLYSIYVWIVGIREVHRATTGQAVGIVLLPMLVIAALPCLVVFAMAVR